MINVPQSKNKKVRLWEIQQTKLDEFYKWIFWLPNHNLIEWQTIASSKFRWFFFILVRIIKIWIVSSFYNFVHIYEYTLKYFTVLHIIWSEISKFHDMTTKYKCTSQTAADFRLYTADFAKLLADSYFSMLNSCRQI